MAFTGAATVKQIADNVVRIGGTLSLAAAATGTISLFEGAGAVKCPDSFSPKLYAYGLVAVTLIEAVQIVINPVSDVANFAIPIRVVKTGATHALFLITLENDEAAVASAQLEIYVRFH